MYCNHHLTNTSLAQSKAARLLSFISLLHEWMETLDAGGLVRTVFVDYRKAFDHVDHNLLIRKLLSHDIPHCLIRWVHNYLHHRRQRVRVNGELSAWIRLCGGMLQGSWLGPLTFLVLINDLRLTVAFINLLTILH